MKKSNLKTFESVTLIVIALISVLLMCFTLGGDKGTSTGWKIEPRTSASIVKEEAVIFEKAEGKIASIYVNIGEVYKANQTGGIDFTVDFGTKDGLINNHVYKPNHRVFSIFTDGKRNYGWVKLAGSLSYTSRFIKLTTKQSFELKEVVFLDEKGNRLNVVCSGAMTWKNNVYDFYGAKLDTEKTYTCTTDEPESFDISGINTLGYRESEVLSAVNNVLGGNGYYVSKSANVLGVELISLGVLIFGENSFGLRIIPFLFFVATLYVIYFFGKKVFGSVVYGAACSCAYLLSGLGLSFAGVGLSYSIVAFFALLTVWFAYNFAVKGMQTKDNRDWLREILMCTLFLSFALLVDISALILLPAIVIIYVVHAQKAIRVASADYRKASGLEKEYSREVLSKRILSIVLGFVLFFVALPLVLHLICFIAVIPSYSGYYQSENLFAIIFKNYGELYRSAQAGMHFGWIAGLGSQELSAFNGSVYLAANKAFVVLSTLSVLALAVLLFLVEKGKVTSGSVIVGIKDHYKISIFSILAFFVLYLSTLIFFNRSEYYLMIYTLIPAVIATVTLLKVLSGTLKKGVYKAIAIAILAIVFLFFVAQFPCFTQITMGEKVVKYLYGWML